MTTVTTTLVSGQNAYVGAISSRGQYTVTVVSGVQGPAGANGTNANTGNVTFTNTTLGTTSVNNSIVIQTRNVNPSASPAINTTSSWTFGANGTTTFPTNISINYSGDDVQFPRIIADSGKAFSIQGQGNSGSAALAWTVDPNAAGQYAAVAVTRAGGDNLAKVILQAQSNSGDVATVKLWKFDETGALTIPGDIKSNGNINIQALNSDGDPSSTISMRPNDTYTRLEQWSSQDSQSFSTADWTTGTYTTQGGQGAVQFTNAANIINFVDSLIGVGRIYFSVNGGPLLVLDGTSSGGGTITFYTPTLPATDPTTVTTFEYYYSYYSQIEIDYGGEELTYKLDTNNVDLTISTTNQKDIGLDSSRDLDMRGNGSVTLRNSSTVDSIQIQTDTGNTNRTWAFGANGAFTFPDTTVQTTAYTGNTAGFAIGYRDVPQNFTNTSVTLALTDAGKHILTQNSGSSTQTVTIPPNGTVAFQTGAAITIVVQSTGTVAVANGAGVTMYLAGNSTAKSTVTLNSYSMATLLKIGTDTWMVSGTGAT